jgi:hypothetical protein
MTIHASAWRRLPEMLRTRLQWALAGASKAPLSIDATGRLFHTAVNRPGEWLSFDRAVDFALSNEGHITEHANKQGRKIQQVGLNIGFILNESDPFACIDLDVKDTETNPNEPQLWTTPEQYERFQSIYKLLGSYTEYSRSGKGLHIWVQGKIGPGFRRDGIEVYSQDRFIICTGNILLDHPIMDRQTILDNMVSQMRPIPKEFYLEELEPEEDDWYILDKAIRAANGEKFCRLWDGDWQSMNFPSHSEADLALMSILTFYSKSNSQCRRIFRSLPLGQREKAQKNDVYINRALIYIRERQQRERNVDLSAIVRAAELAQKLAQETVPEQIAIAPVPVAATVITTTPKGKERGIPWPPGFAGYIAKFIYQAAPRPVKEVAIVAALGLLAGICGKAWHISNSGLNLYIILIARSAIGKEAMHSGISLITKACSKEFPLFHKFVDFTEYVSGPALIKACLTNPCFVNISGEWGRKLLSIASEDRHGGPMQTLRTQMTNLYHKSGPAAIVGGLGYSATDNNVASVAGVSYSMISETTPGTFYKALTDSMMEDGFLSRFLLVEFEGERPAENESRLDYPNAELVRYLTAIATQSDMMITKDVAQTVLLTEEAIELRKSFELVCDRNINKTQDDSKRQMWNRASLKSQRIAALLAVADNYMNPCVTKQHIEWAQYVLKHDIAIMSERLTSGDVGVNDDSRQRKLLSVMRDYLKNGAPNSYKVPEGMQQAGIIIRNFLRIRATRLNAFVSHPAGINKAFNETIKDMEANGYIMELKRDKLVDVYDYHGQAYRILEIPDFTED